MAFWCGVAECGSCGRQRYRRGGGLPLTFPEFVRVQKRTCNLCFVVCDVDNFACE